MITQEKKLKQEEDLNNFNPFTSSCDKKFSKLLWTKDPDHKYKLKHGLGKATRNIRQKRFKRKLNYNKEEILEVAKKLKSIIDNGAANYDNKTNKTLETYENNNDDNNTVKSGKMSIGYNNNLKNDKNKKNKNDSSMNRSNNILSIPLDENEFNTFEDNTVANNNNNSGNHNSNVGKKKNKKNKNKNKNETEEDNNGIIQIPFAPSAYEDSIEEKKFQMKKELQAKYKELKEEYLKIKEKLNLPEYANDKSFHNKKKQIKKELKAMKEKYKNEMS